MIALQLTQQEGSRLARLLERASELPLSPLVEDHLKSAEQKLGDANAIAVWLGEDVALDTNITEGEALREFLQFAEAIIDDPTMVSIRSRVDQQLVDFQHLESKSTDCEENEQRELKKQYQ